jgi:hypothetical protein
MAIRIILIGICVTAEVAELVDASVSKTDKPSLCRFESGLRYHITFYFMGSRLL